MYEYNEPFDWPNVPHVLKMYVDQYSGTSPAREASFVLPHSSMVRLHDQKLDEQQGIRLTLEISVGKKDDANRYKACLHDQDELKSIHAFLNRISSYLLFSSKIIMVSLRASSFLGSMLKSRKGESKIFILARTCWISGSE